MSVSSPLEITGAMMEVLHVDIIIAQEPEETLQSAMAPTGDFLS
jgi:hypothetical protein